MVCNVDVKRNVCGGVVEAASYHSSTAVGTCIATVLISVVMILVTVDGIATINVVSFDTVIIRSATHKKQQPSTIIHDIGQLLN